MLVIKDIFLTLGGGGLLIFARNEQEIRNRFFDNVSSV